MRILSRCALWEFVESLATQEDQVAAKAALNAWFNEVSKASWASLADLRKHYATASVINAEQITFNIEGNHRRLVVAVDFEKAIVWIKWIGSRTAYDQIK